MLHLERVVNEVGRRIGDWVETQPWPEPKPETKPLFTSFYPPRIGADPFEGLFLTGALAASLERWRQQRGPDAGSVDTGTQEVPTMAEMLRDVKIGQEGFISTNRLLWLAGMTLTWAGSGAGAYKAAEMLMGSDDASGPVRIVGSLVASFVVTSVVNELFLRRLVRT